MCTHIVRYSRYIFKLSETRWYWPNLHDPFFRSHREVNVPTQLQVIRDDDDDDEVAMTGKRSQ